jgi:hypothetical protein
MMMLGVGFVPLWVNRVGLTLCRSLPVYPEQRTSTRRPRWSGSCQQETHRDKPASCSLGKRDMETYRSRPSGSDIRIRLWPSSG